MANNMDSMLDMYLFETNSLLEQLDDLLLSCEKQGTFDSDSVNEIFRIMHTIKGSSAMMQFNSIATISHKTEDLFLFVRENKIDEQHNSGLFDTMFKCSDFLKDEVSKVENDEPLTLDIGSFEEEINNFLKKISASVKDENEKEVEKEDKATKLATEKKTTDKKKTLKKVIPDNQDNLEEMVIDEVDNPILTNDIEKIDEIDNPELTNNEEYPYGIKVYFEDNCQMENIRAFMLITSINEVCNDIKYTPSDIQTNENSCDEIVNDGFTINVKTKSELRSCQKVVESFIYTKDYTLLTTEEQHIHEKPVKKENDVSVDSSKPTFSSTDSSKNSTALKPQNQNSGNQKQSLINVNLTKLDTLMDLVGEIVISESMLAAISTVHGTADNNFAKTYRQLNKLTDELQEIVMSIRMVPVAGVFQKMKRIVRDMSKTLNRNAELILTGDDTEIDKTISDIIGDPLMHLVRNSMDHGVEDTKDRIAKGKSPQGKITLSAENTGGEILIKVQDDGKGIDTDKILAKAGKNGILVKPETEYTKKEILSLIMMPGFSTNEVATEFSGRGVGMDVVKKGIEKVGGTISIDSDIDKGTTFILKIPLTLAIVKGIEISVGKSFFIVPINNINQSFKVKNESIVRDTNNKEIVMIRNEYYPVIRLSDAFALPSDVVNVEDGILMLVENGDFPYCIFADKLLGENQVVLKPLPIYLNRYNLKEAGVSGCAILGNGDISIILDIPSLSHNLNNVYK